jgi:two-component system CheB/CheR fusion protein
MAGPKHYHQQRLDNAHPQAADELATQQTQPPAQEAPPAPSHRPFPIVGIGASAGGLHAIEALFAHLPADPAMAFVLVQHLDPTHKSSLPSLLQSRLRLQVLEIKDGMKVKPNHLFLIPPNRDLGILHATLQLTEPMGRQAPRLPIDRFFRTLAQDQGQHGIGVILSGSGSDGTLGLKAIKEMGGIIMVQAPDTAEFDAMPGSAIATGLADFVLPPDKIANQLLQYRPHAARPKTQAIASQPAERNHDLSKVLHQLRTETGHDFSHYKSSTLLRRIERRLRVNQLDRLADYARYLQHHPVETQRLFKELLIGVSSFFRDTAAFETLQQKVIPALFQNTSPQQPVRVWVPGCATGEEAYSLAILLREHMERTQALRQAQVFATDIDRTAVVAARTGVYPPNIGIDVSEHTLKRFFVKKPDCYQVTNAIREMVVFAEQDLVQDPPFSKLDLISCRNVLIYMDLELQEKLLAMFYYVLNPNGYLFLGNSETIGVLTDLFAVIDRRARLFQRKTETTRWKGCAFFPTSRLSGSDGAPQAPTTNPPKAPTFQQITERLLLEQYAPKAVLANSTGDILYVHGDTGSYLRLPPGEAQLNLAHMVCPSLRPHLMPSIRKATTANTVIRQKRLLVKTHDKHQLVDLTVAPVSTENTHPELILLTFTEVPKEPPAETEHAPPAQADPQRIQELEQDLRSTKEHLQTTIEELETANEELNAHNEELQSSLEEVRSTNQELESTKEELQSLNEELITVNAEQEAQRVEMAKANDDLANLLGAMDIGILFLDLDLKVRRYTPAATQIVNLIATDRGRPLTHLAAKTKDNLVEQAHAVLNTLVPVAKEIQTREGRVYQMRILPYQTTNNMLDGALMTFVDITEQKQLGRLATVVRDANDAINVLDFEGRILAWNQGAVCMYGWTEHEALDLHLRDLVPEDRRKETLSLLHALTEGKRVASYETQRLTKDGRRLDVWMTLTTLRDEANKPMAVASTERDLTEHKQLVNKSQNKERQLRMLMDHSPVAVAYVDADQRCQLANQCFAEWFQTRLEDIRGRGLKEVLGEAAYGAIGPDLEAALAGQEINSEHTILLEQAGTVKITGRYLPDFSNAGEVTGCLTLFSAPNEK